MALTVEECDAMIAASREHGVKLGIGFENRHHPAHIELRRLVTSGELGRISAATAQYSRWLQRSDSGWRADPALSGGGSIMGLGVHCLDIARFVLADEPEEVVAMTDEGTGGRAVDEIVLAVIRFAGGTFCQVTSGMNVPRSHNDIVLYGEAARAQALDTIGVPLQGSLEISTDEKTTQTTYPVSKLGTIVRQIEAFQRNIRDGGEPDASGEDGKRMVVLAGAVLESSRERTAVRLPVAA
jgi:predicted dehydrogenase